MPFQFSDKRMRNRGRGMVGDRSDYRRLWVEDES